jgi:hypothetical protein
MVANMVCEPGERVQQSPLSHFIARFIAVAFPLRLSNYST